MIDEKVKEIIAKQLGVNAAEVTMEASFVEDLGADSLDTVELVMAFEETLMWKYLMKTQRKSQRSKTLLNT